MPRAVQPTSPHKYVGRGEEMKTKKYAATYQFRKAIIHIDDSYCANTPEEEEEVDANIATALWAIIEEIWERGEEV